MGSRRLEASSAPETQRAHPAMPAPGSTLPCSRDAAGAGCGPVRTEETMEAEDELVPFARIVEELGWPAYRVRLAMGKAGNELREAKASRYGRSKVYPLAFTVRLLREGAQAESDGSEVESEERVSFERIVRELGSSPNTVRRHLRSAQRSVVVFSDPRDKRKKLYPLSHTLKVLRREETRVQARRDRSRDPGAGYWLAVAELKVAAAHLQEVSGSLAAAARKVSAAHGALRGCLKSHGVANLRTINRIMAMRIMAWLVSMRTS